VNNKPVTIPKFTRVDAPPVRNSFQYFLTRAATWSCSPYVRIPARAPLGGEGPPKNRATRWPIARNHDKEPTRKAGSHM
jgi:hypothetical protein